MRGGRVSRRLPALIGLGMLAGVLSASVSGCGGPAVTHGRLEDAIAPLFVRQYALQQQLLGRPAVNAEAAASCRRNDSTAGDTGAGDDWVCTIALQLSTPTQALTYEVNAKADGCFTADGPTAIVGGRTLRAADGSERVNPLFAFDGCYDIS